jgi:DNA polymerase-1
MSSRRLLLVDGMAGAYRAFYAIRDLSTRDGRPTNAVFGFIRMLRQLRACWAPTHWAVVFDGGLPEQRTRLLEAYKAQRPAMPDPLRAQLEWLNAYLAAAGVFAIRVEGQEADDVMASLARGAGAEAAEVLLATNDKDMYQIVTDRVTMVGPAGKGERMGPAEVRAKIGVGPDSVVDWLALVGDASDNIPGVPGVGAKTAAQLLGTYGSVAGLWANLESVGRERLRAVLRESRDLVERNRAMVKLDDGLNVFPGWEALEARDEDPARVLPLLESLELESLACELRERRLL